MKKIAIINLTGGGMSGGYRKYLCNVLPRMAMHHDIEAILCVSSKSLNIQDWFGALPNVKFVDCEVFRFLRYGLELVLDRLPEDSINIETRIKSVASYSWAYRFF